MKTIKLFSLCVLIFLSPVLLFGQGNKQQPKKNEAVELSPDEKALKQEFLDYLAAYDKVTETKDLKSVLQYVSPELSSTLVTYDVQDRVKVVNSDYNAFVEYLKKVIRNTDVTVNYQLKDVLKLYTAGNIGVVVANSEYEIIKDGGIWSKGMETNTFTFKRINRDAKWKLIHLTVIGVEDEKTKGACSCEIYRSSKGASAGSFVVKTTVPSGRSYNTLLNNFDIIYGKDERTINVETNSYRWLRNGDIFLMKDPKAPSDQDKKIATAHPQDELDAILTILRTHLYSDNCISVKPRN
jgi:hypothetical protein